MTIKVVELFAGVGGFRVGLEKSDGDFPVIWSNQWEPKTKTQHASMVYEARFGAENHVSEDIAQVPTKDIPQHDMLVGGFPCQDYSVATTLVNSKGLIGKKGVLWWSIQRILKEKKRKPHYLMLENVDRLLKSPSQQRGRDFAVMLKSLEELGYAVEWRVINAAEYGMPQRRRRVFFLGYHKSSPLYKRLKKNKENWLLQNGVMSCAFPCSPVSASLKFDIKGDLQDVSDNFNVDGKLTPFANAGYMIEGNVFTIKVGPEYKGKYKTLKSILQKGKVDDEFYLDKSDLDKWKYLKGAKKYVRESKSGIKYNYAEGALTFPDDLNKASRTIITGEGGKAASRFKHVIETPHGLRRLTPVELEKLNMFPANHTQLEGISNTKRAFFMGNALVVGIVTRLANSMYREINEEYSKDVKIKVYSDQEALQF